MRKAVLDAVHKAQGQGCAPGILGVSIGGDRGTGYSKSKEVLFDKIGTPNADPKLAALDVEYQRADEDNDNQKKQQIRARKQALRDITIHPGIEAAQTPDDLLAVVLPE